ncbi:MAG TPA: tetratricopeptide repeat protein [Thermoanaerobaculia bacterium]|nr:tetratricopeptide repeat protein [Thermoanaerobaculia bacterium]
MRRWIMILIAIAAIAVSVIAFRVIKPDSEWSSGSQPALEAFRQGLEAEKKLYWNEAREHYARAAEIDPDFVMARFKTVSLTMSPEREQRLRDLIDRVDLESLTSRERFLMEYRLSLLEKRPETAEKIMGAYLAENPNDLYALTIHCDVVWIGGNLDAAEDCFEKVRKIDPGWAHSHNNIGYIRMARGDFAGAEEAFASYRQLAPDQANPHDSLGELLMLTGRYEEALNEFEQAVAIRADFCATWSHLVDLMILQGDTAGADRIIQRAENVVCSPEFIETQKLRVAAWKAIFAGNSSDVLTRSTRKACEGGAIDPLSLAAIHQAALNAGDTDFAADLEEAFVKRNRAGKPGPMTPPLLAHLTGMRLASEGAIAEAIAQLRESDRRITYNGGGMGLFKMYNRLALATLLEQSGAESQAAQLRAEVREISAPFADHFARIQLGRDAQTKRPEAIQVANPAS